MLPTGQRLPTTHSTSVCERSTPWPELTSQGYHSSSMPCTPLWEAQRLALYHLQAQPDLCRGPAEKGHRDSIPGRSPESTVQEPSDREDSLDL